MRVCVPLLAPRQRRSPRPARRPPLRCVRMPPLMAADVPAFVKAWETTFKPGRIRVGCAIDGSTAAEQTYEAMARRGAQWARWLECHIVRLPRLCKGYCDANRNTVLCWGRHVASARTLHCASPSIYAAI